MEKLYFTRQFSDTYEPPTKGKKNRTAQGKSSVMSKQDSIQPSMFPESIGNIIQKYQPKPKNKFVSREFQDFGYRLAAELNDLPHKSLYIRLAKTVDRGILESARSFVIDSNARSKAKLFMWKLKELRAKQKGDKISS